MRFYNAFLSCLVGLLVLYVPVGGLAQEVEEVVVQGQVVESAGLDDLVSSAVLDAEKLADAGIENVEDVAAYVPNLVLTQTETGTAICIRGICPGTNQGFDQSVGLYSDGVPLPRANMARAPFLDLGSVQVLRGPQYVTDGNYSIAGSIHMITNLNTNEPQLTLNATYVPSFNENTVLLTGGGPFNDMFAARAALQVRKGDNYVENLFQPDNADREEMLGRFVFGFTPNDAWSFKLKVEKGAFDSKGRNLEVIHSTAVPTDFAAGLPMVISPSTAKSANCVSPNGTPDDCGRYIGRASGNTSLAARVLTETDISHTGVGGGWDFNFGSTVGLGNVFGNGRPFEFAGVTALDTLAEMYQRFEGAVPTGLLDASADWRRATNTPETSTNDLNNITFNAEYFLGDSQFTLVASQIDYTSKEVIDSDFTLVSFLSSQQQEEYNQDFYQLQYESSGDNFIDVKAGISHLASDLEFSDQTTPAIDFVPLGQTGWVNPSDPTYVSLPESTLTYFFARTGNESVTRVLDDLALSRTFTLDTEIDAAYLQMTINWTDQFRTRMGARYTRAEKTARRELCYLNEDTGQLRTGSIDSGALDFTRSAFGVEFHCDVQVGLDSGTPSVIKPTLADTRVDEDLLPSIYVEWDVSDSLSLHTAFRLGSKVGGFDARSLSTPAAPGSSSSSSGTNNLPVLGSFEFEDELATTYEIGTKWYFPMGQIFATAFFTEFKNLQTSRGDGRIGQNVGNASAAETAGIEVEGQVSLTDRLAMSFSLGYIDFKFKDFKFGSCPLGRRPDFFYYPGEVAGQSNFVGNNRLELIGADPVLTDSFREILYPGDTYTFNGVTSTYTGRRPNIGGALGQTANNQYSGGQYAGASNTDRRYYEEVFAFDSNGGFGVRFCDFSGQTNQYVAARQATVSFDYSIDIANFALFHPSLDVLYNSGYHTALNQDDRVYQDAYTQINGRLALESFAESWEMALVFENITNEKIIGNATLLPLTSQLHASPSYAGFVRSPRAVGLNFKYRFL